MSGSGPKLQAGNVLQADFRSTSTPKFGRPINSSFCTIFCCLRTTARMRREGRAKKTAIERVQGFASAEEITCNASKVLRKKKRNSGIRTYATCASSSSQASCDQGHGDEAEERAENMDISRAAKIIAVCRCSRSCLYHS